MTYKDIQGDNSKSKLSGHPGIIALAELLGRRAAEKDYARICAVNARLRNSKEESP